MRMAFRSIVLLSAITTTLLLSATLTFGQGIVTGSISGTVEDAQGAVVPGAKITATELSTNREYTTVSTSAGVVALRGLPPGTYKVQVESPTFRNFESANVAVVVGADTSLGNVKLEPGAATETVTVEGTQPLIEATTDQISAIFDTKQTQAIPIGNSFDSLTLFVPGVATAGDVSFSNNNGAEFAVNGQRARSNNFQIDGQNNNDNSIGGPDIFFGNQDAIAEVQVVTNYSAEYGRNMGAVVNYITKNGTNQFHGTAYEFWTGNTFSSLENEEKSPLLGFCTPAQASDPTGNNCTKAVVPQLVDNRFGGTMGGPIKRNKIWFYGSGNFERERFGGSPTSSAPALVPTPTGQQELSAAFPNSPVNNLLAEIGPNVVKAGNPSFSNIQNVLVTDQIDPSTGFAFNCTAAGVNGCTPIEMGSISRFVSSPFNDYEATGRVDFRLSEKDNFFARYIVQKQINSGINFGLGIDVGDWQTIPALDQQIGLDWTRSFSNTFLNQVRASYSRAYIFFNEGSYPGCNSSAPLACPTEVDLLGGVGSGPQDSISYGELAGFPQGRIINVYQLQDNASKLIGRHTLKFGGEVSQQRSPNVFLPLNNGDFLFGSFNDLVANNPEFTLFALGNPRLPFKEFDTAAYFQDDWHVKDNLTLNLGLRWEWYQQAVNLLHDRAVAAQKSSNPLWDPTLPLSLTTPPPVSQDLNNFSPVVGFAWTPRLGKHVGDGNTVIRGGFRMAYDPAFYNMFLNEATAAPAVNLALLLGPPFGGTTVLPNSGFFGTELAPYLTPQVPRGNPGFSSELLVDSHFHNPYSEQWNIGIQRSINSKIVAEVRYVGNHTIGNFQTLNGNPALEPLIASGFANLIPSGLTPCTDPNAPGFGFNPTLPGGFSGYADCNRSNLIRYGNTAWSKYNGLQTELRIGGWHGLTATASYTFSHTIDNASEIFSTAAGGNTNSFAQNPFNTDRGERGNAGIDFPHVAGVTFIYDLPFYKNQQGFVGRALGGWELNSTYRYTTGQPYTTVESLNSHSLCDPTSTFQSSRDACRPILANPSAPLATAGAFKCTGATAATCTLTDFVSGAPTTLSAVHWVYNDPNSAIFYGTPYAGAGRNILRGQPISTSNLAVFKNINVNERLKFQFQAQAFNWMNVQFRGVPDPRLNHITGGSFQNTNFNANGGLTFAGNLTTDGLARRRLLFGLKAIF
jgi:outer membrane receptor protein involved in Fe transport